MEYFVRIFIIALVLFIPVSIISAQETGDQVQQEKNWAVGLVARIASIPFATGDEKTVSTLVPLIFYEGDHFFMRGIEGGIKLWRSGPWRLSFIGRMHFFDFPKEYQNRLQGDNIDWGIQVRYQPFDLAHLDLELLSDWEGNFSSNTRLFMDLYTNGFRINPYAELKLKSKKYNSYYYGLTLENVKGGADISIGIIADYRVWRNFYFYGAAQLKLLDRQVRNIGFVNSDVHAQALFGVGISNDRSKPLKETLRIKPYIRLAHGWATPTDLAKIFKFEAKKDTFNNQLTSVFYGHPLTDEIFGLPFDIYLSGGFVWHWASHVQNSAQELVIAIKLYYMFNWPIRWKLGAAEGMSYVNEIPYVERTEMEKKGYRPSNLMNFLDFSFDFNIGDIFGGNDLKRLWIGYSIHHRSSIFEKVQQFGRIKGGSNFQTVYLQWDL